ncbi:MAG: sigma-54 interaction domain-containing protein [Desulfitobacteriaceae bacterium]
MKSVTIVAKGKSTSEALYTQLNDLLGNKFHIRALYLDGPTERNLTADLLVLSSQACFELAKADLDPNCPVIIARRSVNYHEIDKLLSIPPGTDVLLVNDYLFTAEETISLLRALGIDHLNYYPYAPEAKSFPRLRLAVTPGETELIPDFVEEIIDIQTRIFDFTTLVEILKFLNLLDEKANLLSAKFLRDIIELIKKSNYMAKQNRQMKNQLETIINTVHDGIIALNEKGQVSVFNSVAEGIFGLSHTEIIGKDPQNPALPQTVYPLVTKEHADQESFIRVNGRHLVVSSSSMTQNTLSAGRVLILKDVTEIQRLEEELRRKLVTQQYFAHYTFNDIQGTSSKIQNAKVLAKKLALSQSPVLIEGESGTGKELFVQSIHNASARRKWPFVAVNVAALPESLLESELFGYDQGAFTGAKKEGAPGLFEQAHKGTIFLDEIGDAPVSFQVKLLRVLQEKQVRRIGSSRVIPIDVRVIVATNRILKELINSGQFRQDLYYRLNVLPLHLPPLRERKEDIMSIAMDFYTKYFEGRPPQKAQDYFRDVQVSFLAYDWPGNIRELQNIVEYLVNVCPTGIPSPQLLPAEIWTETPFAEKSLLIHRVLTEIAKANGPIGRRSLSSILEVPEAQIRKTILALQLKDYIKVNRGMKGLELTPVGVQALGNTLPLSL